MTHRPRRFAALIALCASALLLLPANTAAAGKGSDAAEIRTLISATYDQPNARVQTDPVIVVGNHAIADWIQGKRGGRALMRHQQGQWEVVMCAGDSLRHADTLTQAGVPSATAKAISQKLGQAEKNISISRRQQFDLFGTTADPAHAAHHVMHPDQAHTAHKNHKP